MLEICFWYTVNTRYC